MFVAILPVPQAYAEQPMLPPAQPYHPKSLADLAAASSNACLGSLRPLQLVL